uniref:Lateral signaling target protein 2 homolog isoform X1 n=1 Tax=Petromyzon marinus TaxID=7757 RepID=A0AAJ7TUL8_PETMA|nr:lateral signaling target protein 2 homolog isoform X1 [Petromyzon marinus]
MLSGQQHSAVQVKRSLVKDQVREVIGGLEIVLGELKDVAKELKEVVSQIDTLTASLNLDEETDDSKCSTLNSSSSGNTGSSGGGAAAVARFSTTVSAARFSTTVNAARFSTTVSAFASRTSATASVLTVLRKPRPPPPPPRTTPVSLPQLPFCEDSGQRGSSLEPTEQEEEEEEQGTVAREGGGRERKREVRDNFCCQRRQFELSYTAVRQRTELVRDSASYQHDQSNHYYHHPQQHLQQQHRYQHRQVEQHALKDRVRFNDLVEFSDLVEEEEEDEGNEDPLASVQARGHPLGQIVCNQSALQVEAMQLRHHHQLHHHHQQQQHQLACSVQLNAGALQALPPSGFVRDSRSISYHARDTTVIAHAQIDSEGQPPPKAILRKSKNTVV